MLPAIIVMIKLGAQAAINGGSRPASPVVNDHPSRTKYMKPMATPMINMGADELSLRNLWASGIAIMIIMIDPNGPANFLCNQVW